MGLWSRQKGERAASTLLLRSDDLLLQLLCLVHDAAPSRLVSLHESRSPQGFLGEIRHTYGQRFNKINERHTFMQEYRAYTYRARAERVARQKVLLDILSWYEIGFQCGAGG